MCAQVFFLRARESVIDSVIFVSSFYKQGETLDQVELKQNEAAFRYLQLFLPPCMTNCIVQIGVDRVVKLTIACFFPAVFVFVISPRKAQTKRTC